MYEDNKCIVPFAFECNKKIEQFIEKNTTLPIISLRPDKRSGYSFDALTYKEANIPLECKWSRFFVQRKKGQEKWVYQNTLELKKDEYVFVHDDWDRGYKINDKYLPTGGLRIIRSNEGSMLDIFSYLKVIENAKEVHCIDSCFLNLIDCMQLRNEGLFFHQYVRRSNQFVTPTLRLDWEVLKDE
jgi:hypothetical protein